MVLAIRLTFLWLLMIGAAPPARCSDVLVYHNDGNNDGQNLTETILTPSIVGGSGFGKLFTTLLDGAVFGQVLYKSNLNITAGAHLGVQNVAFVATANDTLYAINADTGVVLWKKSLLYSFHGGTDKPRDLIHSVTATMVIDPVTGVIYVEAYELENGNSIHELVSFNIADGSKYANHVIIAEGTSSSVYVSGPSVASGKKFDAKDLMSRLMTLDPVNHVIYIAYGDFPDTGPYNGWVIGYSAVKNAKNDLVLKAVWCSTPHGSDGGIWESGGGIAIDASGSLYIETGNGTFDTGLITAPYSGRLSTNVANLLVPGAGDYGDSVIKLTPDADASQQGDNPNGFGLHVSDYFTPRDEQKISNSDTDLGSGGVALLPDAVGSPTHRQLLVANDKQGIIYLIDRNNMGVYHGDSSGMGGGTNNVVQELDGATGGMFGTPAFYAGASSSSGTIYYVGRGDFGKTFNISNASITPTGAGSFKYSNGATPEISANGGNNGIVWTLDKGLNVLIADNASSFNTQLFMSAGANALTGSLQSFYTPTIANGHVYVATSNTLNGYGSGATSLGLPDLIATSLSYFGGIFTSVVKNQGNAATPSGVTIGVAYSVDGVKCTWGAVNGPLAAGASVTIGSDGGPCTIANGTHVTAFADDVNRIAESDETNNTLSQSITVTATTLPDLIPTSLSYSNGIFTSVVKNQGAAATPNGVSIGVSYSVDGVKKTWGYVTTPLAPGASTAIGTQGGAYTIPSGTHTITIFADDTNRISDSDKTNNTLSRSITPP
jgi:CARDB/PQQ-like domain